MALILKGRAKLKGSTIIGKRPYAIDGVYNPELVFDFQKDYYRTNSVSKTFANAITHTRASTATYVDADGILQTAATNVPRIGHHVWNGSAWVNEGLLHESEARTNLLPRSEEFDNAAWGKFAGAVIVADQAVSPDGGTNADQFYGSAGAHVFEDVSASENVAYTASLYVKSNGTNEIDLLINFRASSTSINYFGARFNLATQAVTTPSPSLGLAADSTSIQDAGNGWYRITVSKVSPATTTIARDFIYSAASASTVSDGFFIWGAQLEAGPTPSSYIPTAGSAVTRAADVLTVPAANLPYPTPTVIGPELVTNGTFDTDTANWASSDGAVLSVESGRLKVTNGSALFGDAAQLITTQVGKVYQITASLLNGSAASRILVRRDNAGGTILLLIADGYPTETNVMGFFVAISTTTAITISPSTDVVGNDCFADNISVREINPLALSIQMDGAINYADKGLADQQTFLRWQLDTNNFISVDLDTDSTATGEVNFNQASGGVFDTVVTSGTALAPSIATAFNIASRHGSTFINGALNGTALTADTTPVALANLAASNLNLGFDYMGTIKTLRVWGQDITDAGLVEATS